MGLELSYFEGQTPLDEDEKEGLLITSITTRGELDQHEQLNIEKAIEWTIRNRFRKKRIFTEDFVCNVHKRMFGDTWSWAGRFRKSDTNIGVEWTRIGVELKMLLDDAIYWVDHSTYSPDEIAIRFKYRLVKIHCFPNGNGRHSRLIADIIIESLFDSEVFTWTSSGIQEFDKVRSTYLQALREADQGNIDALLKFARG